MEQRQFFLQLLLTTAIAALVTWGMHQAPRLQPYWLLSTLSLGGFTLLSVVMYYAGRKAAYSSNKHDFTNIIMGFTMGKMALAFMLIFAYLKLAEPTDKIFILPFFVIYLIYTIFETYFMMKLSRLNT